MNHKHDERSFDAGDLPIFYINWYKLFCTFYKWGYLSVCSDIQPPSWSMCTLQCLSTLVKHAR